MLTKGNYYCFYKHYLVNLHLTLLQNRAIS